MQKLFFTLLILAMFYGCSESEPVIYENNAEPAVEWGGTNTVIERPNAHSGRFVSVIDSINPYSLGFGKRIKDIGAERIKLVTISYWVLFNSTGTTANTVLNIVNGGKSIFWMAIPVQDKVKELNTWTQVEEKFPIADTINPNCDMGIYVWNTSKKEVLIDDIRIEFKFK